MYAVEFETTIDKGKIKLPREFEGYNDKVKVIILTEDPLNSKNYSQKKTGFNSVKIHTKGFKMNREELHER